MIDSFAMKSDAQLLAELYGEIEILSHLSPEDQQRIISLARGLVERGMALPFVLAGARSTAAVLADLEESGVDPVMERPEVRRFVAQNGAVTLPSRPPLVRGNDVKRAERERLQQKTVAAIREARRSRGRHEIKKTRSVLMRIDQRELRHHLGREGDELCQQINTILRSMAPLF
jgi:hypothetical protein